jgi:hypothetical protein
MREIEKWLHGYEKRRTDFYGENKALLSSKFDLRLERSQSQY